MTTDDIPAFVARLTGVVRQLRDLNVPEDLITDIAAELGVDLPTFDLVASFLPTPEAAN